MRIVIPYRVIEENTECVKEYNDYYPYADELEYEFTVDEAEIDYSDLEDIVDEYISDIIEILLRNHRKELEKAITKRVTHG